MHYLKRELYDRVQRDEEVFEFLQAGSLDGIWYWDLTDTDHEWYSDRFATVLGYEPSEVPPKSSWWQENIFQEDIAEAYSNFEKHCADASHPYDQIVRYRHKDGSTVWIRCRGLVLRDEQGVPVRMLGAHTDVTDVKQAEAAARELADNLVERTAELERSNRELRAFARVLAHDLKQPLRNVSTYLGLLEMQLDLEAGTKAKGLMSHARDSASRMSSMLADILDLATLETEHLQTDTVDLAVVVDLARKNLLPNEAKFEIGPLPNVRGSAGQLLRIFQNVFGNAIKYARPETAPHICVETNSRPGELIVTVSDRGIGFENEFAGRIFELFHQLDPEQSEGSGIGLTVVKKVMELHGGRAWAHSSPETGTTVSLAFPVVA